MDYEAVRLYCLSLPGTSEDLPFDADTLALRVGGKIFALLSLEKVLDPSVNLKCDPERAITLREQYSETVLPGYHMNKKHWNTVRLRGQLHVAQLQDLMKHSYDLVLASLPASVRKEIMSQA